MKQFLFLIALLSFSCSKNSSSLPPAPVTSLKLTVIDKATGLPVSSAATIQLYASEADFKALSNAAIATTDGTGTAVFTNLKSQVYYWDASWYCKSSMFESNRTSAAIPPGITTALTIAVSAVGTLKFVNNSIYPFKIDVNGITLIPVQDGGSTKAIYMGTGAYNIKVSQISGGTVQKTYIGTLTCGGTLVTTFPY